MFGFFGVFDRFGGAIGSFVFGVMLAATGSSRPAILTLIVFFALGAWLLSRVDVERGRRLAREAITLPAPVDPDRVLVAGLTADALDGLAGKAERITPGT